MAHPQRSIAQMIIDFHGGKSAAIGMVQNVFQKNYQVITTQILELFFTNSLSKIISMNNSGTTTTTATTATTTSVTTTAAATTITTTSKL